MTQSLKDKAIFAVFVHALYTLNIVLVYYCEWMVQWKLTDHT